jgi:hypothetical protein
MIAVWRIMNGFFYGDSRLLPLGFEGERETAAFAHLKAPAHMYIGTHTTTPLFVRGKSISQ